jgi:hypothetical protein
MTASDSDLWIRLGETIPAWAESGLVPPVTVDRFRKCLRQLDPTDAASETRKEARRVLRARLNDLYDVMIEPDWFNRGARQQIQAWREPWFLEPWRQRRKKSSALEPAKEPPALEAADGDETPPAPPPPRP